MEYKGDNNSKALLKQFDEVLSTGTSSYFELDVFEDAIQAYGEWGEWKKALQLCEIAQQQHPFSGEIPIQKARLLIDMQRPKEALEQLDQAAIFSPTDQDLYLLRGNALAKTGDMQAAITAYEQALPFADSKAEVYFNIGMAFQKDGHFMEAYQHYKNALLADMSHEDAVFELCYCLRQLNKPQLGIHFFEELLEQTPYAKEVWYNLGVLYLQIEKPKKARDAFEYTTLIDETHALAFFQMGNALMDLKEYHEAFNNYLRVLNLDGPDAEIYCYLGASKEKVGELKEALKFYRKSIEQDEGFEDAWYGAANCLYEQEHCLEAIHFIKKAIKLQEYRDDFWLLLANAEYDLGNVVASEEAFERSSKIAPDNPEVWLQWSFAYYDQGEKKVAINILSLGLEELPNQVTLIYRMTAYLLAAGRWKQAYTFLEQALLLDFDQHTLLYEFFDDLNTQKALCKVINQFREDSV